MNEQDSIGGEALDLLIGLLQGKLMGTSVDVQIHLRSYSMREKKSMLKNFIEEEGIANGRKAEALAEYHLNRI